MSRGNSPCPAWSTNRRSACPVYVGRPVDGPVLWETTIAIGISAIPANESPSVIRQNPPPEVPTAVFLPATALPRPARITAISLSGWKTVIPSASALAAR